MVRESKGYHSQSAKDLKHVEKLRKENEEFSSACGLPNRNFEDTKNMRMKLNQNVKTMEQVYETIENRVVRLDKICEDLELLSGVSRTFCRKRDEIFRQVVLSNADDHNEQQQLHDDDEPQKGLTTRSVRRFHLYTADETHVGDQCKICLEDVGVGRRMRRLTCDGMHCFCKECIEVWFANHNTCPLCRHVFD